jgi:hypothetical protein
MFFLDWFDRMLMKFDKLKICPEKFLKKLNVFKREFFALKKRVSF